MKVFLSWSGERSKAIAQKLKTWLPDIIQAVEPWMSDEDIPKGSPWDSEMFRNLESARFGISCLTPENLTAPWLLFEAGALAKSIGSFFCPFLFQVKGTDIDRGPFPRFQMVEAMNNPDVLRMMKAINAKVEKMGERFLTEKNLEKSFDRYWPDLECALTQIPPAESSAHTARKTEDKIDEILEVVREMMRDSSLYLQSFAPSYENLSEFIASLPDELQQVYFSLRGEGTLNSRYDKFESLLLNHIDRREFARAAEVLENFRLMQRLFSSLLPAQKTEGQES